MVVACGWVERETDRTGIEVQTESTVFHIKFEPSHNCPQKRNMPDEKHMIQAKGTKQCFFVPKISWLVSFAMGKTKNLFKRILL